MEPHGAILQSLGLGPSGPIRLVTHNSANSVAIADGAGVVKLYAESTSLDVAAKEALLYRALSATVPVPPVIAYGLDPICSRPYIITGICQGEHLGTYWESDGREDISLQCRLLGLHLGSVHMWDASCMRPELVAVMPKQPSAALRAEWAVAALSAQHLLEVGQIAAVARYLDDYLPGSVIDQGLLHGCYRPSNILAHGTQITGIVDWEDAVFGDPREELALTLYRSIPPRLHMVFRAGYRDACANEVSLAEVRAFALLYYLSRLPEIPNWGQFPGKQAYYRAETKKILEGTIGA